MPPKMVNTGATQKSEGVWAIWAASFCWLMRAVILANRGPGHRWGRDLRRPFRIEYWWDQCAHRDVFSNFKHRESDSPMLAASATGSSVSCFWPLVPVACSHGPRANARPDAPHRPTSHRRPGRESSGRKLPVRPKLLPMGGWHFPSSPLLIFRVTNQAENNCFSVALKSGSTRPPVSDCDPFRMTRLSGAE